MLLIEIAQKLREEHGEKEIVRLIKDGEILSDYDQQNYPYGVCVYANEEIDSVLFGSKSEPSRATH